MEFIEHNEMQPVKPVAAGKSLRYVVMSVLNRVGNYSTNEYRRLLQLAIECVQEELSMYHATSLEIYYAIVDDTGIVQMPKDCIDYIKIGMNVGGQLYILGMNENIILSRATKCAQNVDDIARGGLSLFAPINGYSFIDHMSPAGLYVGGLYGLGGGFTDPQYRWDDKLKRFQLNGSALHKKQVIVEYQSTGIGAGTILELPIIAPIRDFVIWQRIENDPRVPQSEKDRKERKYNESIEKLRAYKNMFTKQEFLDTMYRSYKQGIKR